MCCSGYCYGPVEDAVAERVLAHTFVEDAAQLAHPDGPFEWAQLDGQRARVLRTIGGRCVFLDRNQRCIIHKELGAAAKPAVCQVYPFNVAVTPDGIAHISLNMECGGFAEGARGPLLEHALGDQLEVILSQPAMRVPESIRLSADRMIPYSVFFDTLEAPWLEDIDLPGYAVSDVLVRLCQRLLDSDLKELGEPAGCGFFPVVHRPLQQQIFDRISVYCAQEAAAELEAGNLVDVALNRRVAAMAASLSTERSSAAHPDLPGQIPGDVADTLMRIELRNVVFGKAFLRAPFVAAGLGFEAIKLALAAALAGAEGSVDEAVINEALRIVNRCLRQSSLVGLSADAPALCADWARALGAGL